MVRNVLFIHMSDIKPTAHVLFVKWYWIVTGSVHTNSRFIGRILLKFMLKLLLNSWDLVKSYSFISNTNNKFGPQSRISAFSDCMYVYSKPHPSLIFEWIGLKS